MRKKNHTPRVKTTTTTTATATYNREKNITRSNHIHIWTRCIQPYSRNALYKYTKIYIKHSIKSSIFMMLLMCNDDMKWCCGDDGRWLWNVSNDSCWLRFFMYSSFLLLLFLTMCERQESSVQNPLHLPAIDAVWLLELFLSSHCVFLCRARSAWISLITTAYFSSIGQFMLNARNIALNISWCWWLAMAMELQ